MRTGCSSRPQSRGTGLDSSTYFVSKVRTDPLVSVEAGATRPRVARPGRCIVRWLIGKLVNLEGGGTRDMTIDNGVNVQALLEAREVLKGAPEAAQFTWRASSKWQNGVHSEVKVENFFG